MPNMRRGGVFGESGNSDCAARASGAIIESRNGSDSAIPAPFKKRRREMDCRVETYGAPVGYEDGFMAVISSGIIHSAQFHARWCGGQTAARWKVGRFFRLVRDRKSALVSRSRR